MDIVQIGTPVLRAYARALSIEEIKSPSVQALILEMQTIMRNAPGVGLAAPQIGLGIQLAVIEDREEYHARLTKEQVTLRERQKVPFHVIINPQLILDETETVEFYEGCLSVAGLVGMVPRARKVQVSCLNEKGESVVIKAQGWYARILQHEIDHLHGTLCVDRMDIRTLSTVENYTMYHVK